MALHDPVYEKELRARMLEYIGRWPIMVGELETRFSEEPLSSLCRCYTRLLDQRDIWVDDKGYIHADAKPERKPDEPWQDDFPYYIL